MARLLEHCPCCPYRESRQCVPHGARAPRGAAGRRSTRPLYMPCQFPNTKGGAAACVSGNRFTMPASWGCSSFPGTSYESSLPPQSQSRGLANYVHHARRLFICVSIISILRRLVILQEGKSKVAQEGTGCFSPAALRAARTNHNEYETVQMIMNMKTNEE